MPIVRTSMAMSADGYTAGPNQSMDAPLGEGMRPAFQWQFETGVGEAASRLEPVPADATDDQKVVYEHFAGIGAWIMGRNMFGGGTGPWPTDEPWDGWWGPEPPYHGPVFVLTSHPREPLVLEGGTTFTFVTEGPEHAFALAKEAAGDQDIRIAGGAHTVAQYLQLGLIDELEFHVGPVVVGAGERPFEGVDPDKVQLELDRVIASPTVTHVRYRVIR